MTENNESSTLGDETTDDPIDQGAASTGDSLLAQLDAALADARHNKELYLRSVADLENYRRRMAREKDELRKYATTGLLEELIPALDNLRLGLQSAEQNEETRAIVSGFAMVATQLNAALEQHGLSAINPDGKSFDPTLHECVAHQPHDSIPENHVIQVLRPGYQLHDRLLRPASVVVSSGPAEA
jgi:molecular chaperone GrpE